MCRKSPSCVRRALCREYYDNAFLSADKNITVTECSHGDPERVVILSTFALIILIVSDPGAIQLLKVSLYTVCASSEVDFFSADHKKDNSNYSATVELGQC